MCRCQGWGSKSIHAGDSGARPSAAAGGTLRRWAGGRSRSPGPGTPTPSRPTASAQGWAAQGLCLTWATSPGPPLTPGGGADPAGHRQETSPSCRKELRFICSKNHGLKKPVGKCTVCVPRGVASSRGTPDPRPACVFTAHLRPQVRSPVRREPRFQPKPPAPPLARPPPLLPRAVQKQTEPNPCSKKKKTKHSQKPGLRTVLPVTPLSVRLVSR